MSEDFVPVSEFKAHAAQWLRRLTKTGAPVIVTLNGKPAGVLLSPRAFDELNEQARLISAVSEGIEAADAGRVYPSAEVKKRIRARYARKAR
ncbi:MAG TPA: type II toxin-antitoxin system Phd/YefM family antitoxin [Myxococcales bacterium]|nr:type II toxin-antitoxin system Phd/YefM family antitoxin [Myxococcales bacterium]